MNRLALLLLLFATVAQPQSGSVPRNEGDALTSSTTNRFTLTPSAPTHIKFMASNAEVLRIRTSDGAIFWRGREIDTDEEFRAGMLDVVRAVRGESPVCTCRSNATGTAP